MRQTIILITFFLSTWAVHAKKFLYPIEIMAGSSDIIVIGQIDQVKGNTYLFKINETLKGKTFKTITVENFEEWTCDRRFGKTEKGQKLCLFLKKRSTNWLIINGSTGERLIMKNVITLGGGEQYKDINKEFIPYSLSLKEFKNGIRDFCKCYELVEDYEKSSYKPTFKQLCNDQQTSAFKVSSKFSAWLYRRMPNYSIIKS